MFLPIALAAAALTWYLDKTFEPSQTVINNKGQEIKKNDKGVYPELGYNDLLARRLPHRVERARHIGDWSSDNPRPLIDILPGGNNYRVTDNYSQPIPPNQINNFKKIVHNRENLEQYWRFDNYLGENFSNNQPTYRRSTISNRFN